MTAASRGAWRSLRVQLAMVGFFAIYVPVLLLAGVTAVTETEVQVEGDGTAVEETSDRRSPWVTVTVVALGPAAAALAWWWAGRAVRPIDRVRTVAEDIEGSDLSRRIALDTGPTEVVALASSFDAMLDRLERAAEAQRRLIEEASHELRTPLTVLKANAEVMLAHPEPTLAVYREGLARSHAAATRLQTALDELLVDARGRARTIDRRPADLMTVARVVVADAAVVAAARGITVSLTGPATVTCRLDEATATRAVANLVDNAVRYSPEGSAVAVEVTADETEAAILVTDHGPGVPSEEQDRVFERFWRGRPDTPGTGLGLPIARQIAAAHGGSLTVRSPGPDGDGSVFTLRLRR
ncbi:MAG TPA: HAMP domain-containing sensor histidine kinase [Acidimicrobiales bacterium]|nr:HAMP domain-containing sensor histidine kinase [Acidimicrobiales bacterium]